MAWLPHVVTVEPAGEPVTTAEMRAQVELGDDDSQDIALQIYAMAARRNVEQRTGSKLVTQTVELRCSSFCDLKRIPMAPLQSIASIEYLDAGGAEQTMDPAVYEAVLVGLRPSIRLKPGQSWPSLYCAEDAVRVTAVAGYGAHDADPVLVPTDLKLAIMLAAAEWFRNREDSSADQLRPIPNGVRSLIRPYRTFI